eukprot:SAG31_NODE_19237_length_608_cov_1.768173_1_plen_103_part_00
MHMHHETSRVPVNGAGALVPKTFFRVTICCLRLSLVACGHGSTLSGETGRGRGMPLAQTSWRKPSSEKSMLTSCALRMPHQPRSTPVNRCALADSVCKRTSA